MQDMTEAWINKREHLLEWNVLVKDQNFWKKKLRRHLNTRTPEGNYLHTNQLQQTLIPKFKQNTW